MSTFKTFVDILKNLVLFVISPLVAILALFSLKKRTEAQDLKHQIEVNEELNQHIKVAQDAQNEAKQAERTYRRIRDGYIVRDDGKNEGSRKE